MMLKSKSVRQLFKKFTLLCDIIIKREIIRIFSAVNAIYFLIIELSKLTQN